MLSDSKRFVIRKYNCSKNDGEKLWNLEKECEQGGETKFQLVFERNEATGGIIPRCNKKLGDPIVNFLLIDTFKSNKCAASIAAAVNNVRLGPEFVKVAWLCQLRVSPDYRRQNIGRRMITAVEAWMKNHGVVLSFFCAASDNIPSISLFQSLGYSKAFYSTFMNITVSKNPYLCELPGLVCYKKPECNLIAEETFGNMQFFPKNVNEFELEAFRYREDGFTISAIFWTHVIKYKFTEFSQLQSAVSSACSWFDYMMPNWIEVPPSVNEVISGGNLFPFRVTDRNGNEVDEKDIPRVAKVVARFVNGVAFELNRRPIAKETSLSFVVPGSEMMSGIDARLLRNVCVSRFAPSIAIHCACRSLVEGKNYDRLFCNADRIFFNGTLL